MQSLFEFDTGKLHFVSVTPWQACRLIAQVAMPSQGRLQWDASPLEKGDYVIRVPRLFRNAGSQKAKQSPTKKGGHTCKENASNSHKNNSSQDEDACHNENRRKKKVRRSISHSQGMQAERSAARECCGDRYSRQPHGNLRNLTNVSM
jgi:hypothetical protein